VRLGRSQIEVMLPHAGTMCLLDTVEAWDAHAVHCTAAAPGASHPLRRDGLVPAIAAVEYAAQATAVHGSLLGGEGQRAGGMLVKLSDVVLHADSLPASGAALDVRAWMKARAQSGCRYAFAVSAGGEPIADGMLTIALTAA
jgi:predicted hotdog family 3-hydroxylacyl-ACP dehydratase